MSLQDASAEARGKQAAGLVMLVEQLLTLGTFAVLRLAAVARAPLALRDGGHPLRRVRSGVIRSSPRIAGWFVPLPRAPAWASLRSMAEAFPTGDALLLIDPEQRIADWNVALERLTGIPASEAVGRPCWEVVRGVDEDGSLVCHPGCSRIRLTRQRWAVPTCSLLMSTTGGRKAVTIATILAELPGTGPVTLNVVRNGAQVRGPEANGRPTRLTGRQREVLELLAAGMPAKVIAGQLGISPATVRNHIRAVLLELGCHSQLEAVAEARRRGLV